jgi:hypothetical protein
MGWFNKKRPDPISDRARALSEEIAALEAQIKRLDAQAHATPQPRLRSTAFPHGASGPAHHAPAPAPAPAPTPSEPIFEEVDQQRLQAKEDTVTREHYNDLGIRKYDLAAFFRRIKNNVRGPSTMNPKLVNYLAAGSVQGLRPMRYEKRVARNRFLFIFAGVLALLIGLVVALARNYR